MILVAAPLVSMIDVPPSATMMLPVTSEASSLAKKLHIEAISSRFLMRRMDENDVNFVKSHSTSLPTIFAFARMLFSNNGVLTGPGQMTLQRTLDGPCSTAAIWVSAINPPLEAV